MKRKVYLCGGIFGLSDAECHGWRDEAKGIIGDRAFVVDPTERDYRGVEVEHTTEIVEYDSLMVSCCESLLCYAVRPSWGSAMEVRIANFYGKRIVVVTNGVVVSPWLHYHATHVCDSLAEGCELSIGGLQE